VSVLFVRRLTCIRSVASSTATPIPAASTAIPRPSRSREREKEKEGAFFLLWIVSLSLLASAETGSLCLTRSASLADLHVSVSSSSAPTSTAIPIPRPSRSRSRGPGEREQRQLEDRERAGDLDRGMCHSMHLFLCHPSIASPALLFLSASSMLSLSFTHFFHLSSGVHHTSICPLQSMIPYCFPSHRTSHAPAAASRPIPHPHFTQVLYMFYLWLRDDLRHDHDRFRPPPKPRDDLSSLRGYTSCRRRIQSTVATDRGSVDRDPRCAELFLLCRCAGRCR
jgi:hypothetical protein